jgi:hypothetical protein
MRSILLLAASLSLAGCDMLNAAFTPAADRVNAAFPLPEELEIARTRLLAALEADPPAQARMREEFSQLMKVRALTCSAGQPPGRFDSPARIKSKLQDAGCFRKQDAALDEWVGLRRVGVGLRAPALVPAAPLSPKVLLPNLPEGVSNAALAEQANVLAVRSYQNKVTLLQVPGGRTISTIALPEQGRPASLSPNGRLLAAPGQKSLRIYDVESGKLLWSTDQLTAVLAWLPQVEVIVASQAGTGAPQLIDTRLSRIETYPATEKQLAWASPLPGSDLLVGAYNTATLMQHKRDAAGALDVTAARQWQLQASVGSGNAVYAMSQGKKLVYASSRDVAWLDLESGQQGSWQLSAVQASGFARVSDTALAFDSAAPPGGVAVTRMLDIDKQTVQVAKDLSPRDGELLPVGPRAGYIKRGSNTLVVGGLPEAEEPQDLERFISEATLARQLAKLNEAAAYDTRSAHIEALARQVRAANTQAAIRDGLPRDVVESIRRGGDQSGPAALPPGMQWPGIQPMLKDIPPDAVVTMVGVYESASGKHGVGQARSAGPVRVRVGSGRAPLVLVLSSYEPVNWMLDTGGRKLAAVLVSGYHESKVFGQGAAPVVRIGSRSVYKMDSADYALLQRDVARYVGKTTQVFQGSYSGSEFVVQ